MVKLRNIVKNIKDKRALKNAKETGEKLQAQGVVQSTPKDTQGNYVVQNSGGGINVVAPSGKVIKRTNSGGLKNNKFIPSPQPSPQPQSNLETPTESAQTTQSSTPIKINRSGGVRVGNREYTGNAYIPELQKTANEVRQDTREQINISRPEGSKPIGQGRFSASGELVQEQRVQTLPSQSQAPRTSYTILDNMALQFPNTDFNADEMMPKYGQTRMDYGVQDTSMAAYLPGTVYAYQTGEYKGTPTYTTRVVQERGESKLATSDELKLVFSNEVRPATTSEVKGLTTIGKIKSKTVNFSNKDWEPGVYFEKKITGWSSTGGKGKQFVGGVATGVIPSTKIEVIKDVGTFGVGGIVGAGVKGGSILISKIPKVGNVAAPIFKGVAYSAGAVFTGAYVTGKASQVYFQKDYYQKGNILGSSVKEFSLLSTGFAGGSKGAEKVYGLWKTRGRTEIPLERLTRKEVIEGSQSFPTASTKTHLKLFQETTVRLPELTQGTPGGFHVTPEKFWTSSKGISPAAGTSELPGLYVSSEASIHFSGLTNKGGYSLFNLPTLKSFTSGENPAIAFLKPKGFRKVGFSKVNPYELDGQKFRYAFKQPGKQGYIDVPGMKTEIEGIARVDAGSYAFESGKYYTTIKGVRTPIDTFNAEIFPKLTTGKLKGKSGKSLLSESYGSYPQSSSLFNIRSIFYSSPSSSKIFPSRLSYFKSSRASSFLSSGFYSRSYLTSSTISRASSSKPSGRSSGYSGTSYSPSSLLSSSYYPSKSKTPSYPRFKFTKQSSSQSLIPVFGRRFGKFKIIGFGKTEGQAIGIGQDFAKKTLGATFKVPGSKTELLPGYKTKYSKKEGKVFIQLPKYRLSSGSEKSEIKMFKALKGRKKR